MKKSPGRKQDRAGIHGQPSELGIALPNRINTQAVATAKEWVVQRVKLLRSLEREKLISPRQQRELRRIAA